MTPLEILEAALAKHSEGPHTWCQRAFARSRTGRKILDGRSPLAVCWCMDGILQKVSGESLGGSTPAWRFLTQVVGSYLIKANDDKATTYEQILAWERAAVGLARKEQTT